MRGFILILLALCSSVLLSVYLIFSCADGYTDHAYVRFTTPVQNSLILGTSRAAQGLQPHVLKRVLNRDIFNYSFTLSSSPYGPTYLESVKRKLDPSTTNGTFILTVDPWGISSSCEDPNDERSFRELNNALGNTNQVTSDPNIMYLVNNMSGRYSDIFFHPTTMFLHNDGWLEVNVPMDQVSIDDRTQGKLEGYRNDVLPQFNFSSARLASLRSTIDLLLRHGDVYLVRLPAHPEMRSMEQELMPDFDAKMLELATRGVPYLNIVDLDDALQFTDGNHLHKDSGERVSLAVAEWILSLGKTTVATDRLSEVRQP